MQALKAGIMEIADIFVVNKADREGADRTVASIEAMLALQAYPAGAWRPPIVKTEATAAKGDRRADRGDRAVPGAHGGRARRAPTRARGVPAPRARRHEDSSSTSSSAFSRRASSIDILDRIAARDLDPYTAAQDILDRAVER